MAGERLIYLPLGGAGEIGMNAYVYGYGRPGKERLLLVDLGVAMGPVIASIHEKRDEFRAQIMSEGELDEKPRLKSATLRDRAN